MMQNHRSPARATQCAFVKSPGGILMPAHARGHWTLRCFDPQGRLIEERDWENLVTTQGKNYALDTALDNTTQITAWYVFLIDGTPTVAAGDTFASHAGWTEITAYSEATRQAWTAAAASSGSKDNSGSVATFTINSDGTTIGGGGLGSVNTKGSASGTDILYAAGAFSGGDITLNSGSTVEVTATMSL